MSEFDRSSIPNGIAADFAHATVADFMPGSHEGTRAVEEQAEVLWFEASMTLPEGATPLDKYTTATLENGVLRITSDNSVYDPLAHEEFSIGKDGDNTTITRSWFSYVPGTDSQPATVKPESISLVTGPDDQPIPAGGKEASQADLIAVSDRLDKWRAAIVEVKERHPNTTAHRGWFSRLGRIMKLTP